MAVRQVGPPVHTAGAAAVVSSHAAPTVHNAPVHHHHAPFTVLHPGIIGMSAPSDQSQSTLPAIVRSVGIWAPPWISVAREEREVIKHA